MRTFYLPPQVQLHLSPKRVVNVLAVCLSLVLTLGSGFWESRVMAQCAVVETGDITGNVPYGSSINWANPNRVEVSDDLYARTSLNAGDTTKYLSVEDFGYVLPASATILGIEVAIEVHMETDFTAAKDASLRLKNSTGPIGNDYANPAAIWDSKDNTNIYGGPSDLWGTTWAPADINDPDFGVLYAVTRLSGPNNEFVFVDYVTVTVYYTDISCTLPITLSSFDANSSGVKTVTLVWTTEMETNNSHFEVERSTDGATFMEVGQVAGAGNSSSRISYSFTDSDATVGQNFYRLRQVDYDGQYTYSDVRMATVDAAGEIGMTLYPNPATDQVTVSLEQEEATLTLMDLSGKVISTVQTTQGQSNISLEQLSPGMYLLRADSGKMSTTKRFVKH